MATTLTMEEVKAIETVPHYTHSEEQAYLMLYGEGVFDTIPIEADYTVGDMKLWLKVHKNKDPAEYDLVGPKGRWKMGAGSEVLQDDQARTPPQPSPVAARCPVLRTCKRRAVGAAPLRPGDLRLYG